MTAELPTVDAPIRIGAHRLYSHRGAPVLRYNGDVRPDDLKAVIGHMTAGSKVYAATVVDVSEMGSFGSETRKALASTKLDTAGLTQQMVIIICGASVAKRAIMTMATTAARLITGMKQEFKLRFTKTLDEAIELLDAVIDARA